MTTPTTAYLESTTANANTTLPANTAHPTTPRIGDVCLVSHDGQVSGSGSRTGPVYLSSDGTGGDGAGTTANYVDLGVANPITVSAGNGRADAYAKILTAHDFVSGLEANGLRQLTCSNSGFQGASVQLSIFHHGAGWDAITAARADAGCVTTSGSTSVTDASVVAADVGAFVTGTGIPGGAWIASVGSGTFVLSSAATASGTVTLTINRHFSPHNTNEANGTAVSLPDRVRAAVAVALSGFATGNNALQIAWDGGAAQDPYYDESSTTQSYGGHTQDTASSCTGNSTTTVLCAGALAEWLGRIVTTGSTLAGVVAGSIVTAVTPGVSFTLNNATGTGSGIVIFSVPHFGTASNTRQADYKRYDDADTISSYAWSVGSGTNTHAFAIVIFQTAAPPPPISGSAVVEHDTPHGGTVAGVTTVVGSTAVEHDTPHGGAVLVGTLAPGARATEHDLAHGFAFDTQEFGFSPFPAVGVQYIELVVTARKFYATDVGEMRIALEQGEGTNNFVDASNWFTLTDTDTAYVLPIVGTVTDPSDLWAYVQFRRQTDQSLTPAITNIDLVTKDFTVEHDHALAGTVSTIVRVVGSTTVEHDTPHTGQVFTGAPHLGGQPTEADLAHAGQVKFNSLNTSWYIAAVGPAFEIDAI